MFELIKRAMFTGVGLASMTREKIEELAKEVSRQADLTEAEATKFQAELEKRAASAQEDLQNQIDQRVEQVTQRLGLGRAEDVAALSAKVAALTARLEALEEKTGNHPHIITDSHG
jgi:polyhydroxyalkanoate synthesis regulator phasin